MGSYPAMSYANYRAHLDAVWACFGLAEHIPGKCTTLQTIAAYNCGTLNYYRRAVCAGIVFG